MSKVVKISLSSTGVGNQMQLRDRHGDILVVASRHDISETFLLNTELTYNQIAKATDEELGKFFRGVIGKVTTRVLEFEG